jgi:hypothetical protein
MSDKQPSLPLGDFTRRANEISKRASKERRKRRLPVLQSNLPIADKGFVPQEGVPKTRAECPVERHCSKVRCKWNLFIETGEHRSGRPGLGSVKRDKRGLTTSQPGCAGDERPGTTLRPGWLKVGGLEIEREVSVWLHMDVDGFSVNESRHGAMDYWLKHLRVGEPVHAIDSDQDSPLYGQAIAHAWLTPARELKFDRYPDRMFVVLRRVRPVSSCALDLIEQNGKLTNEQTGNALARHRTLVAREVRRALAKAIETAAEMGIEREDLMATLMAMGDKGRNLNG